MRTTRCSLLLVALVLCAAACRGRPDVPILGFHAVVDSPGRLDVTPTQFVAQLDALVAAGFHSVPLSALLDHADRATPLPERPIVLTFDDGTADAIRVVLPALRARGMVATFFVVSSWIGDDEAHRSLHPAGADESSHPVLTWPEVRALHAAGMEIGSHSRTHPRLPELDDKALLEELRGSRRELEAGLGAPIDLFAYPYNSVRARIEPVVIAAGYRAAVAGQDHGGRSRTALYRIGVYRETSPQELVGYARAGTR